MQNADNKLRIKPPFSSDSNTDVAALRAELELELKNKKQCAYQPYECTQLTLDGYKYCLKHILQDKSAPYKSCSYVYASNGKRCPLPAPKIDKKDFGYCNEHAVKSTLAKNRQNSRCQPPQTAEVLLYSLAHYVKKPRSKTVSSSTGLSDDSDKNLLEESLEQKTTKSLDPFKEIDASYHCNSSYNNVLDLCSESDSDVEPSNFSSIWHDAQADSSDNESVDSETEDYLKYANVYTAEEISSIAKEKLTKLQSLYIEQYRHLQYVFREKKRKYYQSLKREKETCCNIYAQIRENPKEQRLYKKLKAYNKYYKTFGTEAILNKRLHDSRAKITDGMSSKPNNFSKCLFTEGGVKCGERTLPLSKYCRKHILEDTHQVLFKACGKKNADVECTTPVEVIFDDPSCRLHMDIPPIRSYIQLRKNSESDFEDSFEHPENSLLDPPDFSSSKIKTELMDLDYNLNPDHPDEMKTLPSILFEESSSDYFEKKMPILEPELNEKSETCDMKNEEEDINVDIDDSNPASWEPPPSSINNINNDTNDTNDTSVTNDDMKETTSVENVEECVNHD